MIAFVEMILPYLDNTKQVRLKSADWSEFSGSFVGYVTPLQSQFNT